VRLLVTGGAGYIGSVVTAHLLAAGHHVTVLDDLSTGHADAVPDHASLAQGSLLDSARLAAVAAEGFDGVLHFGAKSLVAESMRHPERYWRNNVGGTLELLEAMRAAGIPRLVFSSTAAVYGDPEQVPIPETAPTRPTSAYGASKLAVDLMIGTHARAHGLAATSLRYFNVAGASGRYGERHTTETHLIPIVLEVASGRREQVQVYGTDYPTPDGTAIRDYIHVDDLARAHLLALDAAQPGRHAIYNLGNGQGYSVRQVLEAARRVTGRPIQTVDGPRRPGDPAMLVASGARIAAELGWAPRKPALEDMVRDAWIWLQTTALPSGSPSPRSTRIR
jgi:UDP-glucose 4-epimerase